MYTDSLEMKIFLIYHLLYSIRGDFSKGSALKERHALALKLCKLAAKEYRERANFVKKYGDNNYYKDYNYNIDRANKLKELEKIIANFTPFHQDGRYFRDEFPEGYINMLEYFGIKED